MQQWQLSGAETDAKARAYQDALGRLTAPRALEQVSHDLALPPEQLPLPQPYLLAMKTIPLVTMSNFQEAEAALDEAEEHFRAAGIEHDPFVLRRRAVLHSILGRFDEALQAHGTAEQLREEQGLPPDPDLHKGRGIVYRNLGRYEDSLREYKTAQALRQAQGLPASAELATNLGNLYYTLGQLDDAMTAYREAERLRLVQALPPDHLLAMNRGVVLLDQGHFEEALAAYNESNRIRERLGLPVEPIFAMNRGNLSGALGHYDEALLAYDEAEARQNETGLPPDPRIPFNRALVLEESGQHMRAVSEIARTLQIYGKLGREAPEIVLETLQDWTPGAPAASAAADAAKQHADPAHEAALAGKHYDAFVCYRNDPGLGFAISIKDRLKQKKKVIFRDKDDLAAGPYPPQLEQGVREARNLIVLMTRDFFVKCANPEDGVRLELRTALDCGTRIILVRMPGFSFPKPEELPEAIRDIPMHHAISFSDEYLDAFVMRLLKMMD